MVGTFSGKKSLKALSNKVFRFIQQTLSKWVLIQLSVNSGKRGSGEAVSSPYYPKTLSPYLLIPDDRLQTADY